MSFGKKLAEIVLDLKNRDEKLTKANVARPFYEEIQTLKAALIEINNEADVLIELFDEVSQSSRQDGSAAHAIRLWQEKHKELITKLKGVSCD